MLSVSLQTKSLNATQIICNSQSFNFYWRQNFVQLKSFETLPGIHRVKNMSVFQEFEYALQNHTPTTKLYTEAV